MGAGFLIFCGARVLFGIIYLRWVAEREFKEVF
jgi:hypothetical protein